MFKPNMRIAHIIIAHKNQHQLLRLIERLRHPQFDFYIHLDKKAPLSEFDQLREDEQLKLIRNRARVNWGGNSLLKAITNSLEEVVSLNKGYGYIHLLSAQDYPLMPATAIYDYFKSRPNRNFISYDISGNSPWWQLARQRYEQYHFTDFNFKGKYLLQKIINAITPTRKFPGGLPLYGGSNSTWWTITEPCGQYIINTLNNDKKLTRFLKYCWCTDEFVIASLIMNSPFQRQTVNDNLRYLDWSEGKPSPKLLDLPDFESIKNSEMMFARKFDLTLQPEIMDKIDKTCLNF